MKCSKKCARFAYNIANERNNLYEGLTKKTIEDQNKMFKKIKDFETRIKNENIAWIELHNKLTLHSKKLEILKKKYNERENILKKYIKILVTTLICIAIIYFILTFVVYVKS